MVRGRQKEGGWLGALFTAVGTEEDEEEEEESLFKADAVNEEDSERDRARSALSRMITCLFASQVFINTEV